MTRCHLQRFLQKTKSTLWGLSQICGGVIFLVSCAWFKDDDASRDPELNLKTISLILDTDANYTSATEIDLVMVYKHELMKSLMKMKAAEYYALADQIRRDYPEMLKVWHWELTPGQSLNNIPLSMCYRDKGPFGAVIFARYLTPGDHRVRIGSETDIHVLLKREDLCIIEQGCGGSDQLLPAATDCKGGCGVTAPAQQYVIPLPRSVDTFKKPAALGKDSASLLKKLLQQSLEK